MKRFLLICGLACLLAGAAQTAAPQSMLAAASIAAPELEIAPQPMELQPSETLPPAPIAPPMSPEQALEAFQQQVQQQLAGVGSYSAGTVISAELPDSHQQGQFELVRKFSAPNTLQFQAVRFTGDGFVKSQVINRLLQQEVEHEAHGDAAQTAFSEANYRFSYQGSAQIAGRAALVYQAKPRAKAPGLMQGCIYLDAVTGRLLRAEGTLVKSPSFFIKKIEFTTDYQEFAGASMPVHIHSTAATRLIGRAVVDISTPQYDFAAAPALLASR